MATMIKEIKLSDIRGCSPDTWFATELREDYEPVIVEWIAEHGYYDLIDGHHRVGSAREEGRTTIRAQIASEKELARCAEFGDGEMTESEWIEWMQRRAARAS